MNRRNQALCLKLTACFLFIGAACFIYTQETILALCSAILAFSSVFMASHTRAEGKQ